MIEIPTLETERLILRAPKFEDLEPMKVFFADPVRMKFLGGPIKRGDVWRALLRTAGHWQIRGYGFWHIEDRETGIMCGYTGFLKHIEHPEEELACGVFEGYEGRGIAYEAAKKAKQAGVDFGIKAPISIIDPENHRSRALAERLGAQVEKETIFMEEPAVIYRHSSDS